MVCFYEHAKLCLRALKKVESTTKNALTMFLSLPYSRQLAIKKGLCHTQTYP